MLNPALYVWGVQRRPAWKIQAWHLSARTYLSLQKKSPRLGSQGTVALYFAQFGAVYPIKELQQRLGKPSPTGKIWESLELRMFSIFFNLVFSIFLRSLKKKKVTSTHQRPHVAGRASDTYSVSLYRGRCWASTDGPFKNGYPAPSLYSEGTCDQREHRKKGQRHDQLQSENSCGCPRISLIFFCQFFSGLVF